MRAVHFVAPGGPDALHLVDVPTPEPSHDEVLIRVHATAVNRADLLQREGKYAAPEGESEILGLEAAGTVVQTGENVEEWKVGDRVFVLLGSGGYAEYASVPAAMLMEMPQNLSFEEAAATPEVFLTAFQALIVIANIQSEETVLIHAGASGVGTAAIQIARHRQCRVIVTASAGKHRLCLSLGASRAIDYRSEAFDEVVLSETGGSGSNVILDFLGAPYVEKNFRAAAQDGRVVMLALMGGHRLVDLDLRPLFRKRLNIIASTLRSRSLDYKVQLTRRFKAEVLPSIAEGRIVPVIDSVFPIEAVAKAHERMEANLNAGKIVLTLE